jgi:hypothetical protein
MTTTPNDPPPRPDVVPSGDPQKEPDGLPEWDPEQGPPDSDAEPGQMPDSTNTEVGA